MDAAWYAIYVEEALPEDWSAWFEGMEIRSGYDGQSVLCGPVADQAALHGLLGKIRDLNLTLVAVRRCEAGQVELRRGSESREERV